MAAPLTEKASIKCAHQAKVQLAAGQSKLSVAGGKVLVQGDLMGKSVSGCPNSGTNIVPCTNIATVVNGVASKLTVGGKGVLLDTVSGTTSGTVSGTPQSWSVESPGQSALTTV